MDEIVITNVVLIRSCTDCNHCMFRNGFRIVECWITRAWVSKQKIMDYEGKGRRRPKHVPIPDWCPLGVTRLPVTTDEYALFDGKLRKIECKKEK